METIFVQIASYRDPQLTATIDDCLANASNPSRLRFGICNQTDNLTQLDKYRSDRRFRIITVPHEESNGVCWARNRIQSELYDGETCTLHLDAHHRFVEGWDEKLATMLRSLQLKGHEKPLITTYAPHFDPNTDQRTHEVWIMNFDRFMPEGAVLFRPFPVVDHPSQLDSPIPARFFSGHFAFTLGEMCVDVPHDPNYYFHGEEISTGVRAYTHGYDLFHPNEVILWHFYTRKRTKHWYDHTDVATELDKSAHRRNRVLFGMQPNAGKVDFGKYGFGTVRTLEDYERYAGLRFKDRLVQQYTLVNGPPPNPPANEWVCLVNHPIEIHRKRFTESDYETWHIEFHDATGRCLYRQDATPEEIQDVMATDYPLITIDRQFITSTLPVHWIIRPYSASRGWCDPIKGTIHYT